MVDRTIGRTNLVEAIEQAYGESSPPVCVLEPDEFERLCGKIVEAGDRLRSMNSEPNFNGRLVLPHLGTLRRLVVRPSVPREGSSGELAVFSPRQAAACVRKQKEKDRLLTACRNQDAPLLSRARSFVRYTISNGFVTPIGNQETFPQVVDVEARGLIDTAVYVDAAVLES